MNAIAKVEPRGLAISEEEAIKVLGASLYPGARPESIRMVLSWCKATGRDPMKRPIHIVPMWVKDATTGQGGMRDVLMPGIGTYRTDAATTGQYAGKGEPEFGPDVVGSVGSVRMTYPKWCKVTVQRLVAGQVRSFTALEYWLENYATAGRDKDEPNAMWRKRPYGQLAKCAESQALRMAFPDETGNTNTEEEMAGKTFDGVTIDAEAKPAPHTEVYSRRDEINREVAQVKPETAPAKRTGKMWLDELAAKIAACTTEAELVELTGSADITKALGWFKNGALSELNAMLADAMGRVRAVADDAAEAEITPQEADKHPLADEEVPF
jgi:phage recombination protein Bet